MYLARPSLLNTRGEGLPPRLEADDHVRDHLGRIVRAHADRADPGQELLIAFHVGDQIEHLLAAIRKVADFVVLGHQAAGAGALASFASRLARICSKSSPA